MPVDIVIPSPGESVTDVTIGQWLCADGQWVEKDDLLVEIESDKVTLEVPAPESGVVHITSQSEAEMQVGDVIIAVNGTKWEDRSSATSGLQDVLWSVYLKPTESQVVIDVVGEDDAEYRFTIESVEWVE